MERAIQGISITIYINIASQTVGLLMKIRMRFLVTNLLMDYFLEAYKSTSETC